MDARIRRDALFFLEYAGLLLVALLWVQLEDVRQRIGPNLQLFYALDLAALVYVGLRAYVTLTRRPAAALDSMWLAIDLVIISLAVRLTGGILSEAALTYVWPLMTSAVTRAPMKTLLVGGAIGALYVGATWPSIVTWAYMHSLIVRLMILLLMTLLAYAFARNEAARVEEVARLREQAAIGDYRTRLSLEMHDTTQRHLDELRAQLDRLREYAADDGEASAAIDDLQIKVAEAVEDLRQLVRRIRTGATPADGTE
jgi:signal transduction histidine kinase